MKRQSRKRALIVESNERTLWELQAEMENMGFDARATWSGHEALALLKSKEFELLLVDHYLPDLHTTDFLKRVRRLPIQPWVVVMQSSAPKSSEQRHYDALGALAVVDKNDGPKLRAVVRSCCADEPLAKTQ